MRRVLVVDDDADLRDSLADFLTEAGWDVRCAANGHEALEALERERCDVILLDFMMPGMNGGEFRVAQRARPEIADIPVILVSAAVRRPEIAAVDADMVLRKPFTAAALLQCLNDVVGSRPR